MIEHMLEQAISQKYDQINSLFMAVGKALAKMIECTLKQAISQVVQQQASKQDDERPECPATLLFSRLPTHQSALLE